MFSVLNARASIPTPIACIGNCTLVEEYLFSAAVVVVVVVFICICLFDDKSVMFK